jgi:hypothetical protein
MIIPCGSTAILGDDTVTVAASTGTAALQDRFPVAAAPAWTAEMLTTHMTVVQHSIIHLSSFIVLPICGLLKRKLFQDDMIDGRNE